jgi:hypothetical protein
MVSVHTVFAFVLAVVLWPMTATAMTGNELHEWCQGRDVFDKGLCAGYILGASDDWAVSIGEERGWFCVPKELTRAQLVDVVKKYLKHTPKERHKEANWLIHKAAADAWPCPGKER